MTYPTPTREHACPGGCGVKVAYRKLACRSCWFRLPVVLRTDLSDAWHRRAVEPMGHTRALSAALNWYRANPLIVSEGDAIVTILRAFPTTTATEG